MTTMMKTRQQSITQDRPQDQPLDNSNLDLTHSRTQVLSTLYAHSQGLYPHHGDQPRGQALNDSTLTRNIRPTTSYRPTTKLTTMRHFEPASPHFSLLPLQSEDVPNLDKLVPSQPQRPAVSIPRLFAWYLSQ